MNAHLPGCPHALGDTATGQQLRMPCRCHTTEIPEPVVVVDSEDTDREAVPA